MTARAGERPELARRPGLSGPRPGRGRARRPFDFFARLFGWLDADGCSARARILTRLGAEAQEVADEFLAQVLAAERNGVADLERLADALAGIDITVKREMDEARDEVRVMTVHGAKGLEAPIVIMPETTLRRGARGTPLLQAEDGGFLWAPTARQDCAASSAARAWRDRREDEEGQRLFYVGLTRARDRLVLCGRIAANAKLETVGGWYAAAESGAGAAGHRTARAHVQRGGMETRRFGPDPATLPPEARPQAIETPLPAWALRPARAEAAQRYAQPSRLGEEAPDAGSAPSPLAEAGGLGRYRRGTVIHRLLQLLPDIAPGRARQDAARRLLARRAGPDRRPARRRWPPRRSACWTMSASPPCSGRARGPRRPSPGGRRACPRGWRCRAGWTGC